MAATAAVAACVPGGPIYMGPPLSVVTGTIYALEDSRPLPSAEVCLLASDTTCVRANQQGSYRLATREEGLASVRFRVPGVRPAQVDSVRLEAGIEVTLDCTMSVRATLSTAPGTCRPAPGAPPSGN